MVLKFKNLYELLKSSPSEQDCIDYLEEVIWNGKPISPFDPNSKVYKCANNRYKCKNTGKYFNIKTKTIFESSKIPLQEWFLALSLFSSHKKGISSYQLTREISITQKSAWFLLQRLRNASNLSLFKEMLKGVVEIDEAFIGGSNFNRHWNKKAPKAQGRNWKDKIPTWAGVERDSGNMIALKVSNTKLSTLKLIINANIEKGSTIYSDEWYRYGNLSKNFNHQWVNHKRKEYVNGEASTNAVENHWSHFNRIIYGIHHWVSRKHFQKYLDEFVFRNNTRKYSEKVRFDLLLASTVGKRLTYRELVSPSF